MASVKAEAAICVQDVDVQCVLQFTLIHAAGCALHRHTSRVIHRLELYLTRKSKDSATTSGQRSDASPRPRPGLRRKGNTTVAKNETRSSGRPRPGWDRSRLVRPSPHLLPRGNECPHGQVPRHSQLVSQPAFRTEAQASTKAARSADERPEAGPQRAPPPIQRTVFIPGMIR